MSLASIVSSTSSGVSQPPSSQVIGKNGSFWLPEKIEENFASKVRDSSQAKDGKKSAKLNGEHSGKSKTSGKGSSTAASSGRNATGAEKSMSTGRQTPAQSLLATKARLSDVKLPRGQIAKPVNVLSPRADQASRQGMGKGSVAHQGKVLKNLARNSTAVTENLRDSAIDPDGRKGDGNKHGKRRGAKNASVTPKMEVSHSQQDIQVMEGRESRESTPSVSPQARSFTNLLAKSVLPRISYLDKHAKKVVRFAVDLPNKVKLGVRVEKSEGSLSICFICSDPESLEMLGFTKDALSENLTEQSGKNTQINIFNNYKEMDEHFSRAA
jgi:hypothetical protein